MKETLENPSRRRLFRGKIAQQAPAMRLPWIKSESHFTENCTQCTECIKVCETKIIQQDDLGFPKVDFSQDECTFCGKCQEVCQQPLFIDLAERETNLLSPWPATLSINDKCFAKNSIFCQSCQDVCDTRAISFSFTSSSIAEPSVKLSDCSQCGACISTCPQDAISFHITEHTEVTHA